MDNALTGILSTNVKDLGLSRSVIHFFDVNNLRSLDELLKMPMDDWFSFTGFNQHLLN